MRDQHKFSRPELIAYAYHKAILDRDEATELLRVQYQSIIDSGGRIGTDLKLAITYLGYKAFHEKYR